MTQRKTTTKKLTQAESFYADTLKILKKIEIPFLVGGTYALQSYTGITRPTKDIDIFCKAGDYPRILNAFKEQGYKTEALDERWVGKIQKGKYFIDIIFNLPNGTAPITERWFKESPKATILGVTDINLIPPTEFVVSKAFVQNRHKYDGGDVAHTILVAHKKIDWKRLLNYMEQYWEVLLMQILNFRFLYPSERENIPRWLLDELLNRLNHQANLPTQKTKICRGRLFSREDYEIDLTEWGYEDFIALR